MLRTTAPIAPSLSPWPLLSAVTLVLPLSASAQVKPAVPAATPASKTAPVAGATITPGATAAVATPVALPVGDRPIAVNIDGRIADSNPAPIMQQGSVYVPLRGVLENLQCKVDFAPAERRIEIEQNGKHIFLRLGEANAVVGTQIVNMAPPKVVDGRAYVPLRSLAELFGYRVAWLAGAKTVAIYTNEGTKVIPADHRKALETGGSFGVGIDFTDATPEEVPALLDAARDAGAGIIKVRFDWNTLEPEKGGDFQWPVYDSVVKEARTRGLVVVGILGNCAKWASVASSEDVDEWRNSPPREAEFPAWSNYVKRTVGRYKNDVQAWQVWENPAASNFRSVARTYRKVARLAVDAARLSDDKAIVHAAEPGGVELDFINDLTRNGLTPLLDGISVYPVSQWQPGAVNPVESFLLPYATLQSELKLNDGHRRDYWVGGLNYPTLDLAQPTAPAATPVSVETPGSAVTPVSVQVPVATGGTEADTPAPRGLARRAGLLEVFSPTAQASYLVRSVSLSLAAGTQKVFWSRLRDEREPAQLQPINPNAGTGLLRADNSTRPAYAAFKTLSAELKGRPYAGNLALGQGLVALLFDDGKSGTLVAWSPSGNATLALSATGVDSHLPNALFVSTRPDSRVLDATGNSIAPPDGPLRVGTSPVLITNVGFETSKLAKTRLDQQPLKLMAQAPGYAQATEIKATFDEKDGEEGLFWRKYADFGGVARQFQSRDGKKGLVTEAQRDIFDLLSAKPFIYLDVADDFMYFAKGVPVTITVEVHRPMPGPSGPLTNNTVGFRVEYDSPTGFKSTKWQDVEPGEGWATYSFDVPDATFANAQGYDILINAGGSKQDQIFRSISVRRAEPAATVVAETTTPAVAALAPAPATAPEAGPARAEGN